MLDSAYMHIRQGNYAKALELLGSAGTVGRNASRASWGMLLATHQCKSELDLFEDGIPITYDKNYKQACAYASADEKQFYCDVEKLILFTTRLKVFHYCVENKDAYLVQKWADHYAQAVPDDIFSRVIHPQLILHCKAEVPHATFCGLLMDFYSLCKNAITEFKKNCKTKSLTAAADLAMQRADRQIGGSLKAELDTLYHQIAKPFVGHTAKDKERSSKNTGPQIFRDADAYAQYVEDFRTQLENSGLSFALSLNSKEMQAADAAVKIWPNPCCEYNKLTGRNAKTVDLDGCGATTGTRWLSLADRLWAGPHPFRKSTYDAIMSYYENAEKAGMDAAIVDKSRDKVVNEIMSRKEVTQEEIKCILRHCPQKTALYWRLISMETDDFTRAITSDDYDTKGLTYKEIKNLPFRKMSLENLRQDIDTLKKLRSELDRKERMFRETVQPYAEKALSLPGSRETKTYIASWNAYSQRTKADCDNMHNKLSEKLREYETVLSKLQKRRGTIRVTIFVLVLLIICVFGILHMFAGK